MNGVIMRKLVLTANYQPLSGRPIVGTVDICTPPTNAASATFMGDDGTTEVPWVKGEMHTLQRVDLSTIQVKGTAGDIVTVIGNTN
jgi:hypothetical protein